MIKGYKISHKDWTVIPYEAKRFCLENEEGQVLYISKDQGATVSVVTDNDFEDTPKQAGELYVKCSSKVDTEVIFNDEVFITKQ